MGNREWTKEQRKAIYAKGDNILVSAGAGSGKTTVLIERIIQKIIKDKVDIEDILVVTFTDAAASEMKERLISELYKKLGENPNDQFLQKQLANVSRSNISTIHSFCLNVVKNHFYELGISANVRVGDTNEVELMKEECLEDIFEEKYESEDPAFIRLLDKFANYKSDDRLKEIIFQIYNFIMCLPNPNKWLENAIKEYDVPDNIKLYDSKWLKNKFKELEEEKDEHIKELEKARNWLSLEDKNEKNKNIVTDDLLFLQGLDLSKWDETLEKITKRETDSWDGRSKVSEEGKEFREKAKNIRDDTKDFLNNLIKEIYIAPEEDLILDLQEMYPVMKDLKNIIIEFEERFTKAKQEKNIIDFNDFEHLAYKLLVDEDGNPTNIAKEYNFNEILIDEYQDSNLIQEKILKSVSNGHNIFMVGDVKQSIYKFRQACPDLFINKYKTYEKCDLDGLDEINKPTKIMLYNNFRSRDEVIDFTNMIFNDIMSEELGDIEYNKEEFLNRSGSFDEPITDCTTEVNLIEKDKEQVTDDISEDLKMMRTIQQEARLTGIKIREMVAKGYKYRDICVLLRNGKRDAEVYVKELTSQGINVFSESESNFLDSIEMLTMMAMLKIIDNPLDDINLVTVLRSPIGGFNDNELIELRLLNRNSSFYECLKSSDSPKAKSFLDEIAKFRADEKKMPLNELIWEIITETGYYYYVSQTPDGKLRQANLIKLFEKSKEYEKSSFKGLFNFIQFINRMSDSNNKINGARLIGEKDDVVRIMTIHHSKGLEFPVVIISSISKHSKNDSETIKLLLDQDIGIGISYVGDIGVHDTIIYKAIKKKQEKDTLSEEMRVFYVALTRAKDKLILIGNEKNIAKELDDKRAILTKANLSVGEKIPAKYILKKSNEKFKDWVEFVKEKENGKNMIFNIVQISDLDNVKTDNESKNINPLDNYKKFENKVPDRELSEIDNIINFKYKHLNSIEAPSKTSVTAIKESIISQKNISEEENEDLQRESDSIEIPLRSKKLKSFETNPKEHIDCSKRGTLIHKILQRLSNIANKNSKIDINEIIDGVGLNEYETKFIKTQSKIFENYVESDLFEELKKAKEIHTEKAFFMNFKYDNLEDKVLVQGVIDLYFINEKGEIILVDYKTDNVSSEDELVERYKIQLDLYNEALTRSLGRNVSKSYIFSTKFNKLIIL